MAENLINGQGNQKPSASGVNFIRQKNCLLEDIVKNEYRIEKNVGHATILLPANSKSDRMEDIANKLIISVQIKNKGNPRIDNVPGFENMVKDITREIINKLSGSMNGFYGGYVSFDSLYKRADERIFVFEYKIKAKMKRNCESSPFGLIISNSDSKESKIAISMIYLKLVEKYTKERVMICKAPFEDKAAPMENKKVELAPSPEPEPLIAQESRPEEEEIDFSGLGGVPDEPSQ